MSNYKFDVDRVTEQLTVAGHSSRNGSQSFSSMFGASPNGIPKAYSLWAAWSWALELTRA
jgi:hypothetical protein